MEQLTILQNATPAQQEAAAMHYEIIEAAKSAVNSLLNLGRLLKRMRDTGRYKDLGFETFAAYTDAAVGIRQRQAYNYIQVVETLPARLIEENAAAGVTKLALLAKLAPQDREEVAGETLANITVAELQRLVEEKNGLAQQLSLFQATATPAVVEVEAVEIDIEEAKRQAAEEARQEMKRAWAEEKKKLETEKAEAVNSATLKAEKAAAAEVRKAKEEAKKAAAEETARQVEKARREAAQEAAKAQEEKDKAQLERAAQEAREAQQRAEQLAKGMELNSTPDGVKFAMLFEDVQAKAAAMVQLAEELEQKGQAKEAVKYRRAIAGALRALADQAEGSDND